MFLFLFQGHPQTLSIAIIIENHHFITIHCRIGSGNSFFIKRVFLSHSSSNCFLFSFSSSLFLTLSSICVIFLGRGVFPGEIYDLLFTIMFTNKPSTLFFRWLALTCFLADAFVLKHFLQDLHLANFLFSLWISIQCWRSCPYLLK